MTSFVSITQPTHDEDDGDGGHGLAALSKEEIATNRPTAGSFGGTNEGGHIIAVGDHYNGGYPLDPVPLTDLEQRLSMVNSFPIGE